MILDFDPDHNRIHDLSDDELHEMLTSMSALIATGTRLVGMAIEHGDVADAKAMDARVALMQIAVEALQAEQIRRD